MPTSAVNVYNYHLCVSNSKTDFGYSYAIWNKLIN